MAGKGRQGIDYIKPKEPSFLAKFKREIGYKEGPTIDSKKAEAHPESDDDHHDAHDEQPLVVVLKEGDLSKEEYDKHLKKKDGDGTGDSPTSSDSTPSKLSFKKPSKRSGGLTSPSVQFGSSKKKKDKDKSRLNNKNKKVKNESLLSFGDEDEDET